MHKDMPENEKRLEIENNKRVNFGDPEEAKAAERQRLSGYAEKAAVGVQAGPAPSNQDLAARGEKAAKDTISKIRAGK